MLSLLQMIFSKFNFVHWLCGPQTLAVHQNHLRSLLNLGSWAQTALSDSVSLGGR